MKRNLFTLSLPAAVVFGAGALLGGGTFVGSGSPGVALDVSAVVAVVDLDRARLAFPMTSKVEVELREYADSMSAKLDVLKGRKEGLETEIVGFERGTEAHRDYALKIEMVKFEYNQRGKLAEAEFGRRQEERVRDVNAELRKQVAEFAKQKGFQLVLRTRSKMDQPAMQAESYFVEDVVYAAAKLDVTQALIDFLQAGATAKDDTQPRPDK